LAAKFIQFEISKLIGLDLSIPAPDLARPSQPVKRFVPHDPDNASSRFCATVLPYTRAQYLPDRRS